MNLLAFDPYANPSLAASANVEIVDSVDELLAQADFLTLHTPLIASTRGMIGDTELAKMKSTARILNVARGGMIDEVALLSALEAGTIAGAGIDVFTAEPPVAGDAASKLIAHPKVVATPHLGASTAEAQENVSIDVCTQVLSILSGQLPRSAGSSFSLSKNQTTKKTTPLTHHPVNAPIILPEEYRTLLPFISLLEKMGSLYTQHFAPPTSSTASARPSFTVTYEGALASANTTKPLFAALLKGLLSPITSAESLNINLVNAEILARERGIRINESRSRDNVEQEGYSSSVTLRARRDPRSPSASRSSSSAQASDYLRARGEDEFADQVITGFVSGNTPFISRLGRFRTSFVPTGTLLICRNYDSPGKIGVVGGRLGKAGVNIRFMSVAPIGDAEEMSMNRDRDGERGLEKVDSKIETPLGDDVGENEALMILGVEGDVSEDVRKGLMGEDGVLEAGVVVL
jgi:D-3-phosphoglycerate dehydrogenase